MARCLIACVMHVIRRPLDSHKHHTFETQLRLSLMDVARYVWDFLIVAVLINPPYIAIDFMLDFRIAWL